MKKLGFIGEDGSYCFSGIHTYEEPTPKTGDFTVTLTIAGSTGPIAISNEQFRAPKEQYHKGRYDGQIRHGRRNGAC